MDSTPNNTNLLSGSTEESNLELKASSKKKTRYSTAYHECWCPQNDRQLIDIFVYERILADDKADWRIVVLGKINSDPAIITISKMGFNSEDLKDLSKRVSDIREIGTNQIYYWYICNWESSMRDTKIDLIYPATQDIIAKYLDQAIISFEETSEIYEKYTKPFIENEDPVAIEWINNLLDNKSDHTEEILYDTADNAEPGEGFIIVPDYKWDKTTLYRLHLLAIVKDKGMRTLRDLNASHIPMLKNIKSTAIKIITQSYPGIRNNELRMYDNKDHMHVHITHIRNENPTSLSVDRAHLLDHIIESIRICPNYYKEATLVYALKKETRLYRALSSLIDPTNP